MLSPLVALPFLVHIASTLHVGPPKPSEGSSGPEWVDKTIAAGAAWASRVKKCSGDATLTVLPPAVEEVSPTPLRGPLNEFADLSPGEMAWVAEQYKAWGDIPEFIPIPLNTSDAPVPAVREGGGAQEFPLTTGECQPAHGGDAPGKPQLQTCRFQNVYAVKGVMTAHVLESDDFPSALDVIYTKCGAGTQTLGTAVRLQRHKSKGAFDAYMTALAGGRNFTHLDGTTLAFEPLWHFNIGHALYDGLYPAFMALVQWGMEEAPFRVLKLGGHNVGWIDQKIPGAFARNEEVYGLIGGKGLIPQYALSEDEDKHHVLLETLVIGMGRNGQKIDVNANFSLGGGRDLGGPRRFRAHAFKSLGIPFQSAESGKTQPVEGIIIDNRRWEDRGWIEPVLQRAAHADVKLEFLEWGKMSGAIHSNGGSKHNPSPTSSQFRDQLLLISRTRIHISSPGTGMMYQHFLPDGAVHINMGEDPSLPRKFMEEYMAEGAPYFRALYYWPSGMSAASYVPDRVMELIEEAKELVLQGFEIPVPINTNLSPVMRVIKAYHYLTQNEDGLRSLTPLWLNPAKEPVYTVDYAQNFPHRFVKQPTPTKKTLNLCLLAELTKDYGLPCDGCLWGFP